MKDFYFEKSTALDYQSRYQSTADELGTIMGSTQIPTGNKVAISNNIAVVNSAGQPYSFSWKGLRIDAVLRHNYYNRFHNDTTLYKKELSAIRGLEISLNESTVFSVWINYSLSPNHQYVI